MKEHGYVALAVLGDLDVSTDAAWSTGHSAVHSLVTWSKESFSSVIDSVDGQARFGEPLRVDTLLFMLRGVTFKTFLGWSLSLEFG